MIKVFKATDKDFTTNGEIILKPISAVIIKDIEEEYIEVEAPLKYAEFLIQDNILIVDTLTGKKGYKIHNPIVSDIITVVGWICYEENHSTGKDRGVVIAHGKNLEHCEIIENWDDVVTKLIPIGYNGVMLPEGYLSVPSPYQKVYEKTVEFELSEHLLPSVEALEEEIKSNESIVTGLKSGVIALQAKYNSYSESITDLKNEKAELVARLSDLGDTDPEIKEKAIIEAQLPLIDDEISSMETAKANTLSALNTTKDNLTATQNALDIAKVNYNSIVINDLREQAQAYLNVNQFPKINYDLEAHLDGIVEIGDTIKVKHPLMRVDLLTNVIAYKFDCIAFRFNQIEFGTKDITLKGKITEIEEKIEDIKETVKKTAENVTKYYSEYKRDNEELVSKFISEVYGTVDGIYGMIERNSSVFRQTAAQISGTVTRVNADLSEDIASLVIKADTITATVSNNYTDLNGKIASNTSKITQTASEIRSEVSQSVSSLSGRIESNKTLISQTANSILSQVSQTLTNYSTTTQMNSAISQSASSITSSVNTKINGVISDLSEVEQTANKINWIVKSGSSSSNFTLTDRVISLVTSQINLDAYVTFTNLSTVNSSTNINGGNIKTGTIDASKVSVINLNANNIIAGTFDAEKVTVKNLSADSITSGYLDVSRVQAGGYYTVFTSSSSTLTIGGTSYRYINTVNIPATSFSTSGTYTHLQSQYCTLGKSGGYIGFFGTSSATKKSINKVSTAAAVSTVASKLNELIGILQTYNLVGGS